jgi:hypothetical protein
VLGGIGVRLTAATPGLMLARQRIAANDGQIEPADDFASHAGEVKAALAELIALASPDAP